MPCTRSACVVNGSCGELCDGQPSCDRTFSKTTDGFMFISPLWYAFYIEFDAWLNGINGVVDVAVAIWRCCEFLSWVKYEFEWNPAFVIRW